MLRSLGGAVALLATYLCCPASDGHEVVTVSLVGDIHFEGALGDRLSESDAALAPLAPALSSADLTIGNLETAIGSGGRPADKRYRFQAPPQALDAVAAAGINVVSMANNHAADYGVEGIRQALAAADETDVAVVGIGKDAAAAFAPAVLDVRGVRVAVLAASRADVDPTADPTGHAAATDRTPGTADAVDPARLLAAVRGARATADIVVVYLHWGIQGAACPSDDQRRIAHDLVQAGATIVAGTHAHLLQGAGALDDAYVAYGLGNFVWAYRTPEESLVTGALELTVRDGRVVADRWSPAVIDASGMPRFPTGARASGLREYFWNLQRCAGVAPIR